ncbi:MAG: quinolinate synthase NadA [Candidatus Tenebribacter davisii]|jgi:quinolinate synthase|nr:quinolinate synthase NadA [Candidatus Tenebribacter davisii]
MNVIEKIKKLKTKLGSRVVIPAHHYQTSDIVALADFIGDSYKLAVDCSKKKSEFIVFCGVRFMAEGAEVLTGKNQKIILPDLSAGCPLADHINKRQMDEALNRIAKFTKNKIAPVVYMNSTSEVKEICGKFDGSVCTSSNAKKIVNYFLSQGRSVFFAPDYNLGINTAHELDLLQNEIIKVKKDFTFTMMDQSDSPKLFIWDGNCRVHKRFTMSDVEEFKRTYKKGKIIVHPECDEAIVNIADVSGSTAKIYTEIKNSPPDSIWCVGTEFHFVERIAKEFPDKTIVPLRNSICQNMAKITVENLYETLYNIDQFINGKSELKNQIKIDEVSQVNARRSLKKMIEIVEG